MDNHHFRKDSNLAGYFWKLVPIAIFSVACMLCFRGEAYADSIDLELAVGPDEDLTVIAQIDDSGVLEIREFEVDGRVIPTDNGVAESEEVLVALAAAHNGWYKTNAGDWFYFVDGKWVTGWKKISGYWYYFNSSGKMLKGWQSVGGSWYYLRTANGVPNAGPEGSMVVGWLSNGGYWYKLNSSGAMIHGFHSDGDYWYYFRTSRDVPAKGPEGAMIANKWMSSGKEWYAFDSSGHMRTGWFADGGHKYFFANAEIGIGFGSADYGKMVRGLHKIGLYEYYFNDPLHMAGFWEPDGAMIRRNMYVQILTPDGFLVAAFIDGDGHVTRGATPFALNEASHDPGNAKEGDGFASLS